MNIRRAAVRHRTHGIRAWFLAMVALSLPATAQQRGDTLSQFPDRSISGLIAGLPGRMVSLEDVIRVGLQENLDVRLATTRRRVADAIAFTEGRAVDPVLRLGTGVQSSSLSRIAGTTTAAAGASGALPWGTEYSADYSRGSRSSALGVFTPAQSVFSLSVAQPLLDGLNQQTAEWRASRQESAAAGYELQRTRERIVTEIELLYWTLAEAQATEAVFQRSLALSETLLSRNVELAARDLVAEVDVLTTRSGVALRRAIAIQGRQARRDASDRLIIAVYGTRAQLELAADTLPVKANEPALAMPVAAGFDAAVSAALARRKDVAAAEQANAAARIRNDRAMNATRPSLALETGVLSYREGTVAGAANNSAERSTTWRLGLSLSAPAHNRSDRGFALSSAARLDGSDIQLRMVKNDVLQDVRAALRGVQSGAERLAAAEQAASLAWDQLVAERRRLELGLGDSFRLLQTEENAVQAQLEAVRAKYELARAEARYRYATGATSGTN